MSRLTFYDYFYFCENCGGYIEPKKRYCRICNRYKAWLKPKPKEFS